MSHPDPGSTATDPLVELERLEHPAPAQPAGPYLASTAALDEALARQGYLRLTDWAPGPTGAVCEVTRQAT